MQATPARASQPSNCHNLDLHNQCPLPSLRRFIDTTILLLSFTSFTRYYTSNQSLSSGQYAGVTCPSDSWCPPPPLSHPRTDSKKDFTTCTAPRRPHHPSHSLRDRRVQVPVPRQVPHCLCRRRREQRVAQVSECSRNHLHIRNNLHWFPPARYRHPMERQHHQETQRNPFAVARAQSQPPHAPVAAPPHTRCAYS
jgi:hypothetical protein